MVLKINRLICAETARLAMSDGFSYNSWRGIPAGPVELASAVLLPVSHEELLLPLTHTRERGASYIAVLLALLLLCFFYHNCSN